MNVTRNSNAQTRGTRTDATVYAGIVNCGLTTVGFAGVTGIGRKLRIDRPKLRQATWMWPLTGVPMNDARLCH